jgi:hypothetical protein
MNKAAYIMAALGMLLCISLAAGSGEPIHSIDPRISISSSLSLSGLTGQDPAGDYGYAQHYAAATKEPKADRSSRSSSLRPARTQKFDLSIQDISRLILYLNANHSIRADLALYQSGETVFGRGNLTSGNLTREVGVTGTLSHDRLALDLVTHEGDLYKLGLQGSGQSISGEYIATNPEGEIWSGSATSISGSSSS